MKYNTIWTNTYHDNPDNTTTINIYRKDMLKGVMLIDTNLVEVTKQFTWRVGSQGYALFTVSLSGLPEYPQCIGGQPCEWHRVFFPATKPLLCDHINRNRLDNRMINLRHVTCAKSIRNRSVSDDYWEKRKATWDKAPIKRPNNSGAVSFNKVCGKWEASLPRRYDRTYLGIYDTQQEAEKAIVDYIFNHKRRKVHGEYSEREIELVNDMSLSCDDVAKRIHRKASAVYMYRWKLGLLKKC